MQLSFRSLIRVPARDLYRWHARPGAFDRLTPPTMKVVVAHHGGIAEETRAVMRLSVGPATVRWVAEHRDVRPDAGFTDVQISGPFRRWIHQHRFTAVDPGASELKDSIDLETPFGLPEGAWLRRRIGRMFAYRHAVTRHDVEAHRRYNASEARLRIAVTGGTGFIGRPLVAFLRAGGHEVLVVSRREAAADDGLIHWNPTEGTIDAARLEGLDAVVHLAGEPTLGIWTSARRTAIYGSRIRGTELLAETLARLQRPPAVLLSASGTAYYGDSEERLTETSPPGESGFLSFVTRDWERATRAASEAGIRTVHLRIGAVLDPRGGALRIGLPLARLYLAGRLTGSSAQVSWISMEDVVHAIHHLIWTSDVSGPVNITAPTPLPLNDLVRAVAETVGRPVLLPLPQRAVARFGGRMLRETALMSQRVHPDRLIASGYDFLLPDLRQALMFMLVRNDFKSDWKSGAHAQV